MVDEDNVVGEDVAEDIAIEDELFEEGVAKVVDGEEDNEVILKSREKDLLFSP